MTRSRSGRFNRYRLNAELALGDPVVGERPLRELLRLIGEREQGDLLAALAPQPRSAFMVCPMDKGKRPSSVPRSRA